jgi:pyridoxal phosphate enzyme (YggS family)
VSVPERLASVRERIARTGRDPDEVTVVAVTKGFDFSVCLLAVQAGLRNLGENRVQEALKKMDQVEGADWHLIGHLQTNKVRQAAHRFALIQSVDSLHLAEALNRVDSKQKVLIEVNVAREPQRTGVAPENVLELATAAADMLDLQGLMGMGPAHADPTPAFNELRRLRDESQQRVGKALPILSMGMSGDFEAAVTAGSTMVRLGEVLFGPRPR